MSLSAPEGEPNPAQGATKAPEKPGSPLAGIRAAVEAKRAVLTEDIPLPGVFTEQLAIRYHALAYAKDEEIGQRGGTEIEQFMDTLINACTCVLVREDDRWVELRDDQGKLVRFDRTLATELGVPGADEGKVDTRKVLRGVFAAAAGGLGVPPEGTSREELWEQSLAHADHLVDTTHTLYRIWLKGGSGDAEEALGE